MPNVTKRRLLVTGGSGIIGKLFVPSLLDLGYEVTSVGIEPWRDAPCSHVIADLTDFGEAVDLVGGHDAVLHLAAVHREGVRTPSATFQVNAASTFNVFYAAATTGTKRVVWASSCHTGGGRWIDGHVPRSVPIHEHDHYDTGDTYGLSKIAGEAIMKHVRAWKGVSFAAMRYGYVHAPDQYDQIRKRWEDPFYWAHSLWNYVDSRDAFEATRLAIETDFTGAHIFNVTASDQSMDTPTRDLVAKYLPGTTVDSDVAEFGTLFSLEASRRVLGFEPQYSWRQVL
jgi:nucleoside-diphosphate-sugar epimerase